MNAFIGLVMLSQAAVIVQPSPAAVDLFSCPSTDVLVAQGLLAVDVPEPSDGMPSTGFVYRGAGSLNMFDKKAEPVAARCTRLGVGAVLATQVTARLPRGCADAEMQEFSDLILVEPKKAITGTAGIIVARIGAQEVGRGLATSGRLLLLSGSGSLTEKQMRGRVPSAVKERLKDSTTQLVGRTLQANEFLMVEEGPDSSETVLAQASGLSGKRGTAERFSLLGMKCGK